MKSYLIRGIDDELWYAIRQRALTERIEVQVAVMNALKAYIASVTKGNESTIDPESVTKGNR